MSMAYDMQHVISLFPVDIFLRHCYESTGHITLETLSWSRLNFLEIRVGYSNRVHVSASVSILLRPKWTDTYRINISKQQYYSLPYD